MVQKMNLMSENEVELQRLIEGRKAAMVAIEQRMQETIDGLKDKLLAKKVE